MVVWSKERFDENDSDETILKKLHDRFAKSLPLDRINLILCKGLLDKAPEIKKEPEVKPEEVVKEHEPVKEEPKKEEKKVGANKKQAPPAKK